MVRIKSRLAGESVRYNPGKEVESTQERRQALTDLLTPKQNPAQVVYDETVRFNDLPHQEKLAYATQGAKSPGLSGREYEWLKNRINNPAVDMHIPGLNAGNKISVDDGDLANDVLGQRVNALNPKHRSVGLARSVFHPKYGDMGAIYVQPGLPSQTAFNTLAHESGHVVAGHLDDLRDLSRAKKEYEAQAIAYGVQNRFYPWQQGPLKQTAVYTRHVDRSTKKAFEEGRVPSYDTYDYLQTPDAQGAIDAVVQKLVPKPRQPFKKMIPDFWQVTS